MDFELRNILVNIVDENNAKLSAILDWDEAVFTPAFVNCCPPSWPWDFEGDDGEDLDESKANDTPADLDLQEVKRVFEGTVGQTYLRYACTPEYRLACTICRIAITGIHSNDDHSALEKVIEDWNELHPHAATKLLYDVDSDEEGENDLDDEA